MASQPAPASASPAALKRMGAQYGRARVIASDPRLPALTRHGDHVMAYSTLQHGLRYLYTRDGGYLAYLAAGPYHVALGDPLCASGDFGAAYRQFHEHCAAVGKRALALHTTPGAAAAALQHGYDRHVIGVELDLDLADYDLGGADKAYLRRTCNRAVRAGVTVRELAAADVDMAERERIERAWQQHKGGRTFKFLVRPLVADDEFDVRTFYGFVGDQLVGFVTFDPLYRDGAIIGYYQQHMRYHPDAPVGTIARITLSALDEFRTQGLSVLKLGLAPFARLGGYRHLSSNPTFARLAARMFERSQHRYPFRGAYFHKSRYRGRETPVFLLEKPGSRTGALGVLGNLTGLYSGQYTDAYSGTENA